MNGFCLCKSFPKKHHAWTCPWAKRLAWRRYIAAGTRMAVTVLTVNTPTREPSNIFRRTDLMVEEKRKLGRENNEAWLALRTREAFAVVQVNDWPLGGDGRFIVRDPPWYFDGLLSEELPATLFANVKGDDGAITLTLEDGLEFTSEADSLKHYLVVMDRKYGARNSAGCGGTGTFQEYTPARCAGIDSANTRAIRGTQFHPGPSLSRRLREGFGMISGRYED